MERSSVVSMVSQLRPAALAGALLLALSTSAVGLPRAAGVPAVDEAEHGRMLLLLDSSGSMKEPTQDGTPRIEAAQQALRTVVGELPEGAQVGLRVFGAKVFERSQPGACTDSQLVVPMGADNRDDLREAIDSYKPYGETPIAHALREAAKDLGREGKRSIVLVSDGVATCKPDPCDVAARIRKQGIDLRIDVVGLEADRRTRSQLTCIAAAGGGTYYDADSVEDITESITVASERAMRPFTLDGAAITGGATSTEATPMDAGRYVDEVDGDGERWYSYERQYDDSTVIASSYSIAPGSKNRVKLDVQGDEGKLCAGGPSEVMHAFATAYGRVVPVGDDAPEECRGDGLRVKVSGYGDDPRELGLGVIEEPRPTNLEDLPAGVTGDEAEDDPVRSIGVPQVAGEPERIQTPGTTLGDATELQSGKRYSGAWLPGETHIYRVRLDWGQRLAVALKTPEGGAMGSILSDIQLLNPARMTMDEDDLVVPDTDNDVELVGTYPVRWHNRSTGSGSFLAGDYYVLVGLSERGGGGEGEELPYTLDVEVSGDVSGAPDYPDGEEVLGSLDAAGEQITAAAEDPGDSAGKAAESVEVEEDKVGLPGWVFAAGGVGLVVVLAALFAVLQRRGD